MHLLAKIFNFPYEIEFETLILLNFRVKYTFCPLIIGFLILFRYISPLNYLSFTLCIPAVNLDGKITISVQINGRGAKCTRVVVDMRNVTKSIVWGAMCRYSNSQWVKSLVFPKLY